MRKTHSPEEKARIVMEVLRGEETLNEIAAKYEIHPNLLGRWKLTVVAGMYHLFENETAKTRKMAKEAEREKEGLYQQIGKLTTQIEFLKKKSYR